MPDKTDKDKIKVIIWEQLGCRMAQKPEDTIKALQALIDCESFDCWVEDKEEIKLTATYMTKTDFSNLPEFHGF